MNYLSLEFSEADGPVFNLTTDSYAAVFLWKLLEAHEEIRIKLVAKANYVISTTVPINFNEIKYEICNGKANGKLPMLELDGCHEIVGLCSVLRGVCRVMKPGLLATQLLGFKENCLMAPSEVSNWTSFCEREMVLCAEHLIESSGEIQFPIAMLKLERHLANPVRVHNIYKKIRDKNNDPTIKSGSEVDLKHKYCHGDEVNLSDFVLFSIYKLIFSYVRIAAVVDILPLTRKWFKRMETETTDFNDTYESLKRGTVNSKLSSLNFSSQIPALTEEGKYFSLFKRELTGYKNKTRRSEFTDQSELENVLDKLKQLNIDISSSPGEDYESFISDDYVQEILALGDLPIKRLQKKKAQLKSLACEVLKVSQPNDVIVDFCSGTGHLGFLIAKLLPACHMIVVENKEESISRAKITAQKLQLTNVTFCQCNLDYFDAKFDIGLSLHACGVATDLVLRKCWANNASFICSPCCYGKIKPLDRLPQSQIYREVLSSSDIIKISHCSDQTHDPDNVKNINIKKAQQGYFCMDVIDTDRLLRANELGYFTELKRLFPENCTLKNRLLIGVASKKLIDNYIHS